MFGGQRQSWEIVNTQPGISGGTSIIISGNTYRVFTTSDTLTVTNANVGFDIFAIAGGSGGGETQTLNAVSGGGNAGEYVYASNITFAPGSYTITVGAGGAETGGTGGNTSIVTGATVITNAVGGAFADTTSGGTGSGGVGGTYSAGPASQNPWSIGNNNLGGYYFSSNGSNWYGSGGGAGSNFSGATGGENGYPGDPAAGGSQGNPYGGSRTTVALDNSGSGGGAQGGRVAYPVGSGNTGGSGIVIIKQL
jgi:hypothetical protein